MPTDLREFPITVSFMQTILPMWESSELWWHLAAAAAFRRNRFAVIAEGGVPFLFRAWLRGGVRRQCGSLSTENSVLLHWLIAADPGKCLHSHPWPFESEVLSGGYTEQVPRGSANGEWPHHIGPTQLSGRGYGIHDRIAHKPGELHLVSLVLPETWTLVQTGGYVARPWGFHPAGGKFIPANPAAGHSDAHHHLAVDIAGNCPR